jgi:hypothetical protein
VYGLTLVETDANGTETVVPPELICRAKPTTLKDETLQWVSDDEDKRLHETLRDSYYETMEAGRALVSEILIAAHDEGYEAVSTIYVYPDAGFQEHHVLCRHRQSGACVDLVFQHVEYKGDYALDGFITRNHDVRGETLLLYLVDPADIDLAYDIEAICLDDNGHHTQVCLYQSVLWQCQGDEGIDQDRLRQFWSRAVRSQRSREG